METKITDSERTEFRANLLYNWMEYYKIHKLTSLTRMSGVGVNTLYNCVIGSSRWRVDDLAKIAEVLDMDDNAIVSFVKGCNQDA